MKALNKDIPDYPTNKSPLADQDGMKGKGRLSLFDPNLQIELPEDDFDEYADTNGQAYIDAVESLERLLTDIAKDEDTLQAKFREHEEEIRVMYQDVIDLHDQYNMDGQKRIGNDGTWRETADGRWKFTRTGKLDPSEKAAAVADWAAVNNVNEAAKLSNTNEISQRVDNIIQALTRNYRFAMAPPVGELFYHAVNELDSLIQQCKDGSKFDYSKCTTNKRRLFNVFMKVHSLLGLYISESRMLDGKEGANEKKWAKARWRKVAGKAAAALGNPIKDQAVQMKNQLTHPGSKYPYMQELKQKMMAGISDEVLHEDALMPKQFTTFNNKVYGRACGRGGSTYPELTQLVVCGLEHHPRASMYDGCRAVAMETPEKHQQFGMTRVLVFPDDGSKAKYLTLAAKYLEEYSKTTAGGYEDVLFGRR